MYNRRVIYKQVILSHDSCISQPSLTHLPPPLFREQSLRTDTNRNVMGVCWFDRGFPLPLWGLCRHLPRTRFLIHLSSTMSYPHICRRFSEGNVQDMGERPEEMRGKFKSYSLTQTCLFVTNRVEDGIGVESDFVTMFYEWPSVRSRRSVLPRSGVSIACEFVLPCLTQVTTTLPTRSLPYFYVYLFITFSLALDDGLRSGGTTEWSRLLLMVYYFVSSEGR